VWLGLSERICLPSRCCYIYHLDCYCCCRRCCCCCCCCCCCWALAGTCKVQPTADDMPTNAWKSSVWSCKLPMLDGETCIAACANTSANASAADPPQLKCSANSSSSRWDYVKGACSPPPPPGAACWKLIN